MPASPPRPNLIARTIWALGLAGLSAHAGYILLGVGRGVVDTFVTSWLPFGVFLMCAGTAFARALAHPRERAAWSVLGVGLVLYAIGQPYYTLVTANESAPGFPAGSDLLWLSLYPAAIAAIVLLVRAHGAEMSRHHWLDGAIGALAVGSLGLVLIFHLVLEPTGVLGAPTANLSFALGDLVVVGFAVGSCGLLGWRPPRSLVAMGAGFFVLGLEDTAYLWVLVRDTFAPGTFLDSCWLLALLAIAAAAAWTPTSERKGVEATPQKLVVVPFVFGLGTVGLAAYEAFGGAVEPLPVALTMLTLVLVVVRLAVTFRAHLGLIDVSLQQARTDALTGLGNRRMLLRDAELAVAAATPQRPLALTIFDLDGFKLYNDTYGHPAGDALLARIGHKLGRAVAPWGTAYRLGGDEFCALVDGDARARSQALAAATAALTEEGEEFTVSCSHGTALVPEEAQDVAGALRCADRRLYAAKNERPNTSAARLSTRCASVRTGSAHARPLGSRIIFACDTSAAMTSQGPYRMAVTHDDAPPAGRR